MNWCLSIRAWPRHGGSDLKVPRLVALVLADGLAPAIARWAAGQERRILMEGESLGSKGMEFARSLGIHHPEVIRVRIVPRIPLPAPAFLIHLARKAGFPVFMPGGMALGNGIYLVQGQEESLFHELVHVAQYARLGGIEPFMHRYLCECLENGYASSELENEACLKSRW